ncbi:MAG TPA: TraR/DksA C4-type zinc finger protein [Acidimicrobiales bacterium]
MTAPLSAPRPDTSELPADILDEFRKTLEEELADQQRQIAELQATADQLMGETDNDSLLQRELAERGIAQAREVIADIEQSLARIDAGTYGICEGCGGRIPVERLEVIPHTRHCVSCPPPAR